MPAPSAHQHAIEVSSALTKEAEEEVYAEIEEEEGLQLRAASATLLGGCLADNRLGPVVGQTCFEVAAGSLSQVIKT